MSYPFAIVLFILGILVGKLLFTDSKPRSLLTVHITKHGWDANEIAGLFASVVVRKVPGLIPNIILETDKTIVFEHPRPKFKIHYMFVPKKDIKNIGELSEEDNEYLLDLFAAMTTIINKYGITNYRLLCNGPGRQDVAYLHFHLMAD